MAQLNKIAEGFVVPAVDACGKKMAETGADTIEGMCALATQLILMGRLVARLAGGESLEAQILYQHADDAAGKVKP